MPAQDFARVLDLAACAGVLGPEEFAYPCGLQIGVVSAKDIQVSGYVLKRKGPWLAAHNQHHTPGHQPSGVSLYFQTRLDEKGRMQVLSVQCSCDYDA